MTLYDFWAIFEVFTRTLTRPSETIYPPHTNFNCFEIVITWLSFCADAFATRPYQIYQLSGYPV